MTDEVDDTIRWLEQRYVEATNAALAAQAPSRDGARWSGMADAYRLAVMRMRVKFDRPYVAMLAPEWREANGVYSDAHVCEMHGWTR